MFVVFDTDCTQDFEKRDGTFEHVPNLIRAHQMFSKREAIEDINIDCEERGMRVHVFWEEPIGKFIEYLWLSRSFPDKIYSISHNCLG